MTTPAQTTAPPKRRKRAWIDEQSVNWYRFAVMLVGLLLNHWVKCYRAIDAEKVPARGGVFLIANHTSALDPFVLGYAVSQRVLWGPGKEELFANPVVGYLMRKLGIFPIRQHIADAAAVRLMVRLYRAGHAVIVYPEGGRSTSGAIRPFVPEFARLVIKMEATLAPAAIAGVRDVLPIGARIPRRHTPVAVVYGDPFDLSRFYGQPLTSQLAQEAAVFMRSHVAELLAQAHEERERLASQC